MSGVRIGTAALLGLLFAAPGALALQQQGGDNKDVELPPHIARMPFEIRNGYRKFVRYCTSCHDAERVHKARKSLFDWQGTIGEMASKKDAAIPPDVRQEIFLYLAYLHGTGGTEAEKAEYLTFVAKCEDCHGISLVYKEKKPLKDWPGIVHRMAGMSRAKIAPEEEQKVMGYIRRMHPDLFGVD